MRSRNNSCQKQHSYLLNKKLTLSCILCCILVLHQPTNTVLYSTSLCTANQQIIPPALHHKSSVLLRCTSSICWMCSVLPLSMGHQFAHCTVSVQQCIEHHISLHPSIILYRPVPRQTYRPNTVMLFLLTCRTLESANPPYKINLSVL